MLPRSAAAVVLRVANAVNQLFVQRQAALTGKRLAGENVAVIYSSPFLR
jgi:hypothetical protein